MAKNKNALRQHFIQEFKRGEKEPGKDWLELADRITDISDDTNEETETIGYYSGDGTPQEEVISVAMGYNVEGVYDSEVPAMELIEELRLKLGDERFVWHRIVSSDGKKEFCGVATVSAIVAGSGAAIENEAFGCNIRYNQIPKVTKIDDDNEDGDTGE